MTKDSFWPEWDWRSLYGNNSVCVCVSHPLLPALQHSADVLQVVQLLQELEAPLPQLTVLLLLAAPRLLPQAVYHPAEVEQRHAPVGGTLLILFHLQKGEHGWGDSYKNMKCHTESVGFHQLNMMCVSSVFSISIRNTEFNLKVLWSKC